MDRYKVVFSEESKTDFANIFAYVQAVSSTHDARIVARKIAKKLSSLDMFPERSEPIGTDNLGRAIRVVVCGRYRAIYAIDKSRKQVIIARLVSVKQSNF